MIAKVSPLSRFLPLFALALASIDARAAGEDDGLRVTAQCEIAHQPGRVRCDVEARTQTPRTILWADVEVVHTPAFVAALKGRVAPRDATVHDDQAWRWGLAFVAKSGGAGEVQARVRAVVCVPEGPCVPYVVDTVAKISIAP